MVQLGSRVQIGEGFNGLRVPMVKESTDSRVKIIWLSTIKNKLASTTEPEFGTAQTQLVSSSFPLPNLLYDMAGLFDFKFNVNCLTETDKMRGREN